MTKDKIIYYAAAITLAGLYYLADATGNDAIFMLFGFPVGCWIVWKLIPDEDRNR